MNAPWYLSYRPISSKNPFSIRLFVKTSQGINITPKSSYYVWNNPSTTSIEGKLELTPAAPNPHSS